MIKFTISLEYTVVKTYLQTCIEASTEQRFSMPMFKSFYGLVFCSFQYFYLANTAANNEDGGTVVVWHIVVSLLSGIIIGFLLSYIVSCSRRRWFKNKKREPNPEAQTTGVDTTYQGLDLSEMNKEDNYQSLIVNAASNDGVNDDESTYTELNKARDVENNYQSLMH